MGSVKCRKEKEKEMGMEEGGLGDKINLGGEEEEERGRRTYT